MSEETIGFQTPDQKRIVELKKTIAAMQEHIDALEA